MFAGFKWRLELEREKFEEISADLVEPTIRVTNETLDALQAETGSRKIDRFLLVGGSSRMPMVKARIDREFGVNAELYDPSECVAKGAALWGMKRKSENPTERAEYDLQARFARLPGLLRPNDDVRGGDSSISAALLGTNRLML